VIVVARYALRESLRRRVFLVVLVLSLAFIGLYAWGASELFESAEDFSSDQVGVDDTTLAGSTMLGLSMFATLFLGAVLAVFLTLNAVRGDAERGLLQPMIVRPLGRTSYLAGRFLAAAVVSGLYVGVMFLICAVITGLLGWWPSQLAVPALQLAAGAVVIAALALLGSVVLSSTANGIAVFMAFGAGLVAGLLGQIGDALDNDTLDTIAAVGSWTLPFEALYQDALARITEDIGGTTAVIVQLGPFGGAQDASAALYPYVLAWLVLVGAAAAALFARRDL